MWGVLPLCNDNIYLNTHINFFEGVRNEIEANIKIKFYVLLVTLFFYHLSHVIESYLLIKWVLVFSVRYVLCFLIYKLSLLWAFANGVCDFSFLSAFVSNNYEKYFWWGACDLGCQSLALALTIYGVHFPGGTSHLRSLFVENIIALKNVRSMETLNKEKFGWKAILNHISSIFSNLILHHINMQFSFRGNI